MPKILVTGGAGFIGSHSCLVLLNEGYEIIVLDSYINSSPISLQRVSKLVTNKKSQKHKIKLIEGDIRDKDLLINIFNNEFEKDSPIDGVIHFAGLKSVGESVKNPITYWDVNVNGTINLLKVMKDFDCKTIVFSSSATIYGFPDSIPIDEKSEIKPLNPYGFTKTTVEKILYDLYLSEKNQWKIINLRYFNPVGAHPSGNIGEAPIGIPNNIFPFICQVASGKRDKIYIFGNDWPTYDGTGVRDYIHVMDLADGHLTALKFLLESSSSNLISVNLGTGGGISVLELIKKFEAVNKVNIPYEFTDRRDGDAAISIADVKLANEIFGWKAKRDINQICKDGWNWQFKNPNGYK